MKLAMELIIIVILVFIVPTKSSLTTIYGQESTTNIIRDQIQSTAEQIRNMANEVTNNSTDVISQTEAKNILTQLGEAAKKIALGGADVLSNISGEIKEGLK